MHAIGQAEGASAPVCYEDVQFVIKAYGTNGCPHGADLKTVSECQAAAAQLGSEFAEEESVDHYPAGCYLFSRARKAYFNMHATGQAEGASAPVCYEARVTTST